MNQCLKCEAELQDGVKFCPQCGEAVPEVEPTKPEGDNVDGGDDRYRKVLDEAKKYRKRAQDAEAREEALKENQLKTEREKLTENERLKLERDELAKKAGMADRYEAALTELLDKELESIPEDRRSLIPDGLSVADKVSYIARNRAFLHDKVKPRVGQEPPAGSREAAPKLKGGLTYDQARDIYLRAFPKDKGKTEDEIRKAVYKMYTEGA